MPAKRPTHYPLNHNMYVPAMAYTTEIDLTRQPISLGTPGAFDADGIDTNIDADAANGTVTMQGVTADSTFGRTLVMQASSDPGGATTIRVRGTDYLGQPMVEDFVLASGGTAIVFGKKAFYYIQDTVIIAKATNAVLATLGWGYQLGLPYKMHRLTNVLEDGKSVNISPVIYTKKVDVDAALAVAGGSLFVTFPVPGVVKAIRSISAGGGSTTDSAVTIEKGGTAITGLTVTADQGVGGHVAEDAPTSTGLSLANHIRPGYELEVVIAAAASGGPFSVEIDLEMSQHYPADITDPATAATGDPRGLFESILDMNGTREFHIMGQLDDRVNASGNGGLFGIKHYYPASA